MNKLKELISNVKKGLKKDTGANLDDAAIEARWNAMCKFVDKAEENGVNDFNVRHGLMAIKQIRRQERGPVLSAEYKVKRTENNEEKVKLTFADESTLFEFDDQSDAQYDILTCKKHHNLQTKFFFDGADKLTKVSYRDKFERDWGKMIDKYEGEKVIDLTQKQINQEDATEMAK